jgi:hypothetical protein
MITLKNGKKELYQWDFGVKATVGVNCNEVHFSETLYGEAMTVLVKEGDVEIPNQLLINAVSFYCWAFVNDEESGITVAQKKFDIRGRPKPPNYVYTATEVKTIDAVVENAIRKAKERGDFKGDKGDKGNLNYATFEVRTDGCLYMTTSPEYTGQNFEINEKGELEVIING